MKLVAIDFETANYHSTSACSIGIVVVEDGEFTQEYNALILPHRDYRYFSKKNIEIHGITYEDVQHAKEWDEVFLEIMPLLQDGIVVAHNAMFDISVFRNSCYLYGIRLPILEYFCTVELSRKVYPQLHRHKLNIVCDYLGISLNHHDALSDARGCALIVTNTMCMLEEFDVLELLKRTHTKLKVL